MEKVKEFKDRVFGKIAVGKGTVSAIADNNLTITKDGKTYTVNTYEQTKFRRKYWGKSDISEINVGDTLNIIGKWQDEAKTTIQALLVRNLSIQMRYGVFFGTIKAMTGNDFTLETVGRGTQTVTVDSNTKYVNRKEETITLEDLQAGHRLRVRGLWNAKNSTITELTKVKDFSLPLRSSPSIVPSGN